MIMRLLIIALFSLTTILSAKAFVAPPAPVNQETTLEAQAKWEAATNNELAKYQVEEKKREDKSTLGIFSLLSGGLSIILLILGTVGGVSIGGVLPLSLIHI